MRFACYAAAAPIDLAAFPAAPVKPHLRSRIGSPVASLRDGKPARATRRINRDQSRSFKRNATTPGSSPALTAKPEARARPIIAPFSRKASPISQCVPRERA